MIFIIKGCGNNNKDEDNSPKTLNDKKEIHDWINENQLKEIIQSYTG